MIGSASFNFQGYNVAAAEIDPSAVSADGGPEYPRLIIPVRFKLHRPKDVHGSDQDLLFSDLKAHLFIDGRNSKIADATDRPINKLLRVPGPCDLTSTVVEFPLDSYRVEKIEQLRKADLNLRLDLFLSFATFGQPFWGHQSKADPTLRVAEMETLSTNVQLTVPQSNWVNQVLPGLGYGVVHLIELPAVSPEACAALGHSYHALTRAREEFGSGDYDGAIALCRTAVDPIRNELKKLKENKPDSLAADWVEKVGASTIEWLNVVLGKTHGVANTPHHSPKTGYFSRLDAHMILMTTISVVAYVARFSASGERRSS